MDKIYDKLCELLDEMEKRKTLSMNDIQVIDWATHAKKSILCIWKMEDEMSGQSQADGSYNDGSYGGSYNSYNSYEMGNSNRGMSRQQGQSMRRDSMGRFARNSGSYARDDGFWQELEALMQNAPNDDVKHNIQRMMQEQKQ